MGKTLPQIRPRPALTVAKVKRFLVNKRLLKYRDLIRGTTLRVLVWHRNFLDELDSLNATRIPELLSEIRLVTPTSVEIKPPGGGSAAFYADLDTHFKRTCCCGWAPIKGTPKSNQIVGWRGPIYVIEGSK